VSDWVSEKDVSEQLGVSRQILKEARSRLQEGEDWILTKKSVMYSNVRMCNLLRVLELPVSDSVLHTVVEFIPAEVVLARVTRKYPNKRILGAVLDGKAVRVRVPSNVKFLPGMDVPCRLIDEDLYELVGRCPRWRGKF
jgi:hypothetical protein